MKATALKNSSLSDYQFYLELVNSTKKEIQRSKIIILQCDNWYNIPSMFKALESLIQKKDKNQQIVILETYPVMKDFNFIRKERDYIKRGRKIEVEILPLNTDRTSILELVKKYNNVYYFDLSKSEVFKHAPFYNDTIIYYDKGHLNEYGSRSLAKDKEKDFMQFFQPILDKAYGENESIEK